jgi:hypothetical protein
VHAAAIVDPELPRHHEARPSGQDILSDTELFASYCLGSINKGLELVRRIPVPPCVDGPGVVVTCRDFYASIREADEQVVAQQMRLKRYLLARGIPTVRSSLPVLAAYKMAVDQGAADTESCATRTQRECTPGAADFTKCADDARRWPACVQVNRCTDLSRIPF